MSPTVTGILAIIALAAVWYMYFGRRYVGPERQHWWRKMGVEHATRDKGFGSTRDPSLPFSNYCTICGKHSDKREFYKYAISCSRKDCGMEPGKVY